MDGDLEGLIHISEISERRIEHPKEVLHEGDVVTLRIIKIEDDTHRIGLSMRRVDSPAYTDLDWKTLTEELDVEDLAEDAAEEAVETEAVVEEAAEAVEETVEDAEAVVEEAAEAVEEAVEAAEETESSEEETAE
jgi:small subunit ribosomal protein S1